MTLPKLSLAEAEARRLVRGLPEDRLLSRGESLRHLCEARWTEQRGPEPASLLARALWHAQPPLAHLFVDLCSTGDAKLATALGRLTPAQGLAVLLLAEIGRDDAEGARSAYEGMMMFQSPRARDVYTLRILAGLRGQGGKTRTWHRHSSRPPFWKAIAAITAETRRYDVKAAVEVIGLLAGMQAGATDVGEDEATRRLLETLRSLDVTFLRVEHDGVHYQLRGTARKPISMRHLADILSDVEQR